MRYSLLDLRTALGALIFTLAAVTTTACSGEPEGDGAPGPVGTQTPPPATGLPGAGTGAPMGTGSNPSNPTTGGEGPTGTATPTPAPTPPVPPVPVPTPVPPPADPGATPAPTGPNPVPPGPVTPPNGQRILLNMLTTGFRHGSDVPASNVLRDKLTALGFSVQIARDPALFTDEGLAPFKVVVMVQTSGQPAGPASGVEALLRWLRKGNGLVGFHGASMTAYPANLGYRAVIGGEFTGHPGGIRSTTCESVGNHPTVAMMARPFPHRDEIYTFRDLNPLNEVVVRCLANGGGGMIPLSWVRNEGTGRVFYTGLGHGNELWTANSPLVNGHIVPGILWAAGR